jgi:hypothetical protein
MCYWQFTPKTAVRDYKYVILGWRLKGTSVAVRELVSLAGSFIVSGT